MRSTSLALLAAAGLPLARSIDFDVNSSESIRNASATVAYNLMTYYVNNQTSTPPTDIGTFNQPVYWWEAGATWGGLIDYWAYTGDSSYVATVHEAILAQAGPDNNFMPPAYYSQLGNDDEAFWGFAALSALEYDFPVPAGNSSTMWLDIAVNTFNAMASRWDPSTCGGGLRWQIFSSNEGYTYKNTISNGGLFQIAARLYRYTGNQTYLDWAEKSWHWMESIHLITDDYHVYDGSTDTNNCSQVSNATWSYNSAVLVYGTAVLYNATGKEVWGNRTSGLVEMMGQTFFAPFKNSTDIMYEPSCELEDICDTDQLSFKAYLSRWLSKATLLSPSITETVKTLLTHSAKAAAASCSGSPSGTTCGNKWYIGGFDGNFGPGQSLSALETIQSLLLMRGDVKGVPHRHPLKGKGGKAAAVGLKEKLEKEHAKSGSRG